MKGEDYGNEVCGSLLLLPMRPVSKGEIKIIHTFLLIQLQLMREKLKEIINF